MKTAETDCQYCGKAFPTRKKKRFCSNTCRARSNAIHHAPPTADNIQKAIEYLKNRASNSKNFTPEDHKEAEEAISMMKELLDDLKPKEQAENA